MWTNFLQMKGIKYSQYACNIWHLRMNVLINEWVNVHKDGSSHTIEETLRQIKLRGMIVELECRLKQISRDFYLQQEQSKLEKHKLDYSNILLRCSVCDHPFNRKRSIFSFEIIVLFKDYIPGEKKCSTCGGVLTTREEDDLSDSLRRMRIKSPDNN